jgi:8-oxo-dGTP pyrophosphatase MutT (NUDIX family)
VNGAAAHRARSLGATLVSITHPPILPRVQPKLSFHAIGDWAPGHVRLSWAERSSRRIVPEVERIIDETWSRVLARPGVHLFDGPMCRVESIHATPEVIDITLSPTSYKPFLGTNLENPQLAGQYGRDVMATPAGVSTAVETSDGFLMLGRRNASVAYYPNRLHPFAGSLDPRDGDDAFAAVYRELAEELGVASHEVADVRCTGIAEDAALLQPELIFATRCALPREEIERRLDDAEHHASVAVPANTDDVDAVLHDPDLTPVGMASLLLWTRLRWGGKAFDVMRRVFGV